MIKAFHPSIFKRRLPSGDTQGEGLNPSAFSHKERYTLEEPGRFEGVCPLSCFFLFGSQKVIRMDDGRVHPWTGCQFIAGPSVGLCLIPCSRVPLALSPTARTPPIFCPLRDMNQKPSTSQLPLPRGSF